MKDKKLLNKFYGSTIRMGIFRHDFRIMGIICITLIIFQSQLPSGQKKSFKMDESAVAITACDGVGIVVKKSKDKDSQAAFKCSGSDPLMRKKIESKLKIPGIRKCEFNIIGSNSAVIVFGSAEERKDLLKIVSLKIKNHLQLFSQQISLQLLSDEVGNEMNKICQSKIDGCHSEVILTGWSHERGAELFSIESDGTRFKYQACAIGDNKEAIKNKLGPFVNQNISTNQCLIEGLKILMNESDEDFDFKLMRIGSETQGIFEMCDDEICKQVLLAAIRDD